LVYRRDSEYYILLGAVGVSMGKIFRCQIVVSFYKKLLRCSCFEVGKRESYFRDQKLFNAFFFSKTLVGFVLCELYLMVLFLINT